MSNQLEDFFRKNRQDFDIEYPSDQIWTRIRSSINNRFNYLSYWRVAAIIFFMATVGLLILQNSKDVKDGNRDLILSFQSTEKFYTRQIEIREKWVSEFGGTTRLDLRSEYNRLQAMYEVLKIQWAESPTDEIRDALTLNLIVRLDLLNKQVELQTANVAFNSH